MPGRLCDVDALIQHRSTDQLPAQVQIGWLWQPLKAKRPPKPTTAEEEQEILAKQKGLEDPLKEQFQGKLIDLEERHIRELLTIQASAVANQADPLEKFLRYETTIKRDLRWEVAPLSRSGITSEERASSNNWPRVTVR